ncbi:MAG TPA: hypothetical protein VF594_06940, partial [Rubricoccaceae bacterium]
MDPLVEYARQRAQRPETAVEPPPAGPPRVRARETADRLAALEARAPRNAAGQILGSPEVRASFVAALPPPGQRTPYEQSLAAMYEGRVTADEVEGAFGAALAAEMEADRRASMPPARPVDEDETIPEQIGRALQTGGGSLAMAVDEALGQGLDAVGLNRAGAALQARADTIRGEVNAIPVGRQTLDNREAVGRLADVEAPTTLSQAQFGRYGATPEEVAGRARNTRGELAGTLDALGQDPGGTVRALAGEVVESAPTTVAGLAATAVNPALGFALYGTQGVGSQLGDAAHDETGARRDVGARAGVAAVASGLVSAGFETFADKALLGNVGESIARAGLSRESGRAMLAEMYEGAARVARNAGGQAVTEGATEGVQTVIENIGARYGWDPDREIGEGVLRSILVGAVSGGTLAGAGTAAGEAVGAARDFQQSRALARDGEAALERGFAEFDANTAAPSVSDRLAGAGPVVEHYPQGRGGTVAPGTLFDGVADVPERRAALAPERSSTPAPVEADFVVPPLADEVAAAALSPAPPAPAASVAEPVAPPLNEQERRQIADAREFAADPSEPDFDDATADEIEAVIRAGAAARASQGLSSGDGQDVPALATETATTPPTLNATERAQIDLARTLAVDPESAVDDETGAADEAAVYAAAQARAEQQAPAAPAPVLNAAEQAQIARARERVADPESDIDEDAAAQIEAVLTQRAHQRADDAEAARRATKRAEDAELLALIGRAPVTPAARSSATQTAHRSGDGQAGPSPTLATAREEATPTPTPTAPPTAQQQAPTAAPQQASRARPRRLGASAPRVTDTRTGQPAGPAATRRAQLEFLAAQMQDDTPAELPEQWRDNPPETLDEMAEAAIESGDPQTILETHAYVAGEAERQLDPVQNPEVLYAQVRVAQEEAADMLLNGRPERRAYLQTRAERGVSRAPTVQEQLDHLAAENGLANEDAYGSSEGNQQSVLTVEGFQAFARRYPRGLPDVRAAALRPARRIEADFKQRTGLPLTSRTRRALDAYRALLAEQASEEAAQRAVSEYAALLPEPVRAFQSRLAAFISPDGVLGAQHTLDAIAADPTILAGLPDADRAEILDALRTDAANSELGTDAYERDARDAAEPFVRERGPDPVPGDSAATGGEPVDRAPRAPVRAGITAPVAAPTAERAAATTRGVAGPDGAAQVDRADAPPLAAPATPVDRFGVSLGPEARRRWERAFDAARTTDKDGTAPVDRADGLALSVAAGETPADVTEADYAGLLARALDLQDALSTAERQAEAMIDSGR